jgi:predicted metal-dependent enzyme (double-stranded beta helix superfamily)
VVSIPVRQPCTLATRLQALVREHGEAYCAHARAWQSEECRRELMHAEADIEVWLLWWRPDYVTPIHDHGGAITVTTVLSGALFEERFERHHFGVRPAGSIRRDPGDYDTLAVRDVHRVRAVGPTISLHLHTPRAIDGVEFEAFDDFSVWSI